MKKEIANTNFGMLEKSFNNNQKSTLFSSYGVAKHYQGIYGGRITTLTQFKDVVTTYIDPLDVGIEDIELSVRHETVETGQIYIY